MASAGGAGVSPCNLENLRKPRSKTEFEEKVKRAYSKTDKPRLVRTIEPAKIRGSGANLITLPQEGKYLYVIRTKYPDTIYITKKEYEKEFGMKHHILAKGENIFMGGELTIKGGELIEGDKYTPVYFIFDNNSGHYSPDIECDKYLIALMESRFNMKLINQETKQVRTKVRRIDTFQYLGLDQLDKILDERIEAKKELTAKDFPNLIQDLVKIRSGLPFGDASRPTPPPPEGLITVQDLVGKGGGVSIHSPTPQTPIEASGLIKEVSIEGKEIDRSAKLPQSFIDEMKKFIRINGNFDKQRYKEHIRIANIARKAKDQRPVSERLMHKLADVYPKIPPDTGIKD